MSFNPLPDEIFEVILFEDDEDEDDDEDDQDDNEDDEDEDDCTVYHSDPVSFNPLPDEIFEVIFCDDDDENEDDDANYLWMMMRMMLMMTPSIIPTLCLSTPCLMRSLR